jgi:hypothetical protein
MLNLLKGLGLLVAVGFCSTGQALASSVDEEIVITYSSSAPFTLSSLSLTGGPTPGNLLSFTGGSFGAGPGTAFMENIVLVAGDAYSFSFTSSIGSGNASPIFASSTGVTGGGAEVFGNGASFAATATLSPVPLPASFPLFAMALLSLGVFGYYKTRSNSDRFAVV